MKNEIILTEEQKNLLQVTSIAEANESILKCDKASNTLNLIRAIILYKVKNNPKWLSGTPFTKFESWCREIHNIGGSASDLSVNVGYLLTYIDETHNGATLFSRQYTVLGKAWAKYKDVKDKKQRCQRIIDEFTSGELRDIYTDKEYKEKFQNMGKDITEQVKVAEQSTQVVEQPTTAKQPITNEQPVTAEQPTTKQKIKIVNKNVASVKEIGDIIVNELGNIEHAIVTIQIGTTSYVFEIA